MPDNTLSRDWNAVKVVRQAETTLRARLEAILAVDRADLFPDGDIDIPMPRTWWRHDGLEPGWDAEGGPGLGLYIAATPWSWVDGQNEYLLRHELVARLCIAESDTAAANLTGHSEAMHVLVHDIAWALQRWLPEDGADSIGIIDCTPLRTVPGMAQLDTDAGTWLKFVEIAVEVLQRTLQHE
jgi:hypothetical protein